MGVRVSKGHGKVIDVEGSAIQQSCQEGDVRGRSFKYPRSGRFVQRRCQGVLRWTYEHRMMVDHHAPYHRILSGALSRNRQTRRQAWAQSHGSELFSARRVAKGQKH